MEFVEEIQINFNAFYYVLPTSFFPDYEQHGRDENVYQANYELLYEFKIEGQDKITYLSGPVGGTVAVTKDSTGATITGSEVATQIRVIYRTENMLLPRLLYEENPKYPGEVAVMASLVPTFEPTPKNQKQVKVCEDEEPEVTQIDNPSGFLYIFIFDRSGSMSGQRLGIA